MSSRRINHGAIPLKDQINELKKTQEELRIKEFAIASSINGIAIGDLGGIVTYVNKAAVMMWGGTDPAEILGKPVTVFAESEDEALRIMDTVLQEGEWTGEINGKKKNGDSFTVLLSASLVRNEVNEPICLMCSFIDTTERKEMEEDLKVKDCAIASSINGIVITNLKGVITYLNESALKMWGADDPGEALGKPANVFAESEETVADIINSTLKNGKWEGEIKGIKKDRSLFSVLLSVSLVKNDRSEPIHMMCSFVDISDRKQIEEELRIKESAIESSIVGIGLSDLNGNIIYVNEAAVRILGVENPSEVIGTSALSLAQSEEEGLEIYQSLMEKGSWSGEVSGLKCDGSPTTVHISANIVRDEDGEPICIMDSFVDITERKRMEEDLRVKESAIASSIDGIGLSDLEGNIIYVNDAALRMLGITDPSEVIGTSALSLAESEEEALAIYESVMEKGSWTGEISGFRKNNSPATVHISISLVKNEKGEPICIMDSFVDITERKKMEEDLRVKECAIASSINGIGISDLTGNITYVNDAALKMWGAEDASEVIGTSALNLAQSEEEALEIYQSILDKGSWSGEVSGFRKDGSPITLHLSASLVRNEKGEPICMMDSFVDITDRKRMEEEMRVKDFAISSSINGIAIGDLQGNITYVNDAFLRLWGGTDVSEVLGKSALTFAQSQNEAVKILDSVLNKGTWFGEIIAIKRNGTPIAVQLSANMVKNEYDRPICLLCSFVDITERKITEQKLQKAYESLEQRVEDRTEELIRTNIRLKKEVEDRKLVEKALLHKEEELNLKSLNLEEANTALKVLLKRGEQDKNELEEKVLSNIKELALPYLGKLKIGLLDDKQRTYVQLLESSLNDIVSPFLQKLSSQYLNLTPTEIQVANMVREGKSTKEISELLNISKRAIEFHRNNIRDKLGLKQAKANLRSYLLSLS